MGRRIKSASPEPALETAGRDDYTHEGPYVMREHVRRDTGAHAQVLDLDATDRPAGALEPFTGPDGQRMGYAVVCLTHPEMPPHFSVTPQQATRLAKATHLWCGECARIVQERPNSKASARQAKARNQKAR